MTEEHKEKIFNYFWGQIAHKIGMQLSDYRLKGNQRKECYALFYNNGRLRVNSLTYAIYSIPCPFDDINLRLYLQNNSISNRYFQFTIMKMEAQHCTISCGRGNTNGNSFRKV